MGDIRWPDGKKCAVMFTFDVDGDTTWENGNRGLKNGEKYIKSLSVGQYGPKRCVDRILQKLDQYGVKGNIFLCQVLLRKRYPEVIKRLRSRDMRQDTMAMHTKGLPEKQQKNRQKLQKKTQKNI